MRHGADDKKLGNWYYWSLKFYYLAFLPEADDSLMKGDQGRSVRASVFRTCKTKGAIPQKKG